MENDSVSGASVYYGQILVSFLIVISYHIWYLYFQTCSMAVKRGHIDLDPDYEDVTEQQSKRQRVFEEDGLYHFTRYYIKKKTTNAGIINLQNFRNTYTKG